MSAEAEKEDGVLSVSATEKNKLNIYKKHLQEKVKDFVGGLTRLCVVDVRQRKLLGRCFTQT